MAVDTPPIGAAQERHRVVVHDPSGAGEHLWGMQHPDGRVDISVNLHAHTRASDGIATPEGLAALARERAINIAQTDHNCIDTLENDPHIGRIAGIEICTQEGIDVVVIGTTEQVRTLFTEEVKPHLAPGRNWRYCPTALPVLHLADAVREYGMWLIHPHLLSIEGLARLSYRDQKEVLDYSRQRGFIEVNALRSRRERRKTQQSADAVGLPIVATSDAHAAFPDQYCGSYTTVPCEEDWMQDRPPILAVLERAHGHPEGCTHVITPPTLRQRWETLQQIRNATPSLLVPWFVAKTAVRSMGIRLATLIHRRRKRRHRRKQKRRRTSTDGGPPPA